MNELFPILSGLVVGTLIGFLRPRTRLAVGLVVSVVIGVTATVVSGESQLSWAYLLVDIPLVGLALVTAMLLTSRWRVAAINRRPLAGESADRAA